MATKKTSKAPVKKAVATKAPARKAPAKSAAKTTAKQAATTIARGESALRESVKTAPRKAAGLASPDARMASAGTVKPIGPRVTEQLDRLKKPAKKHGA